MNSPESWAHEMFMPIILTCTTPEVERLARKGNTSFTDLLNSFSHLVNTQICCRSVNQTIQLSSFRVRFYASDTFHPVSSSDSAFLLQKVFQQSSPVTAKGSSTSSSNLTLSLPPIASIDQVPQYLQAIRASSDKQNKVDIDAVVPYYKQFRNVFIKTFQCEDYSLLTHPSAMLLVVSSTESNPRHSFEELCALGNLPTVFVQGLYDPNIPKYYLILHDTAETEGTSIDPNEILQNLRIPSNSGSVLRMHLNKFIEDDTANQASALGCVLAEQDQSAIEEFVKVLSVQFVLPALEARVSQLNDIVSAMKKGVKNVFKSWLRKPKELSTRTGNFGSLGLSGPSASRNRFANENSNEKPALQVTYRYDSIEAQTRLLADTAFIIRDYELALQMYRLVRDDFKSDKSMFHCANANEMIAICLLLSKGSPLQMTNALEAAWSIYAKMLVTPVSSRLSVRNAIIACEIYNSLHEAGLYTDYMDSASAALMRGSTREQGICSAVLLERAAFCDIQMRIPKYRKYGFRLVMAGHIYESLDLHSIAARCYMLARSVYDNSGWYQVEDHINLTLAQQANRLQDPLSSILLYLKLIGTGRNSASQQEALLFTFERIVKEFLCAPIPSVERLCVTISCMNVEIDCENSPPHTRKLLVKNLCMPEIDDKSTVMFAPLNAVGIDREVDGNQQDRAVWEEIEQCMILENRVEEAVVASNAEIGAQGTCSLEYKEFPSHLRNVWWSASIQENASALTQSRNKRRNVSKPAIATYASGEKIYIEFVMKNALSCAVSVDRVHVFGAFEISGSDEEESSRKETIQIPEASAERLTVDYVQLQLLPCSEKIVRLSVTPLRAGLLKILGVRWSVCTGNVNGEHAFNLAGQLLQDTRANREGRVRAPNTSLVANIVGHMAWLGVEIEYDEKTFFVGEVIRLRICLRNAGNAVLSNLQLFCRELAICVLKEKALTGPIGCTGQLVDLRDIVLHPGDTQNITVYAKAYSPGTLKAFMMFRYASSALYDLAKADGRAMYRAVRVKLQLHLNPSIRVSYAVRPSVARSGEYIFGISIVNERQDCTDNNVIQIDNIVPISKLWTFSPISSHDASDICTVGQQETRTLYFSVKTKRQNKSHFESCMCCEAPSADAIVDKNKSERFLCLEFADTMKQKLEQHVHKQESAIRAAGGNLRSIQSVRRENKALPISPAENMEMDAEFMKARPCEKEALLASPDTDAHLMLLWSMHCVKDRKEPVTGQHNVLSAKLRCNARKDSNPLIMTLTYESSVTLDSQRSYIHHAELNVQLTIRNNSVASDKPLSFSFEAVSSPNDPTTFSYVGITNKIVHAFGSAAELTIPLKAFFTRPGIYNLNQFRFTIYPTEDAFSQNHATQKIASTDASHANTIMPRTHTFPTEYLVFVREPAAP